MKRAIRNPLNYSPASEVAAFLHQLADKIQNDRRMIAVNAKLSYADEEDVERALERLRKKFA